MDFMGKRPGGPYMHLRVGTIASLFALVLIQVGTGTIDISRPYRTKSEMD